MKEYQAHPIAKLFPLVTPTEMSELVSDIAEKGLQTPITLFEGKILDGRHRYEACQIAEIPPRFVDYDGADPIGFVLSGNLQRRHLTISQRAMVAAKLADMRRGGDRRSEEFQSANLQLDRKKAAKTLDVSERSVTSAKKILNESPKLASEVQNGKMTIHAASEQIAAKKNKEEPKEQLDKVGRPIPKKILELWNRAEEEGRIALDLISKVRCSLKDAQEEKDPIYRELAISSTMSHLNNAYGDFKNILPHAVCNVCQGLMPDKCSGCKGRGFLSQFYWDRCVPSEFKNLFAKKK